MDLSDELLALYTGKLSEEDVKEMLANMELAAPEDVALVKLLSKWAKRGRRSSPEPQVSHLSLMFAKKLALRSIKPPYLASADSISKL